MKLEIVVRGDWFLDDEEFLEYKGDETLCFLMSEDCFVDGLGFVFPMIEYNI